MRIFHAAPCSRLVLAPVLLVGTLLGTAGLAAPAAVAGPSGPSGSWTNTFDEEFNGTALDTSKWMPNWYGEGGASMGWELSSLGYPVGDEYAVPGGRRSNFQHGSLTYRFSDGAILVG